MIASRQVGNCYSEELQNKYKKYQELVKEVTEGMQQLIIEDIRLDIPLDYKDIQQLFFEEADDIFSWNGLKIDEFKGIIDDVPRKLHLFYLDRRSLK